MVKWGLMQKELRRSATFAFVLLLGSVSAASAGVILSDTFESYGVTTIAVVPSGSGFGPWSVTWGSVDLLYNAPGLSCYQGSGCIDMDGSTGAAGTIEASFPYSAGNLYTLSFYYSGNQRGGADDTMSVMLGFQGIVLANVPWNQPWTLAQLTFSPSGSGTGLVRFTHMGGDNVGLLLDQITLTETSLASPVPEPSPLGLVVIGLALLVAAGRARAFRSLRT